METYSDSGNTAGEKVPATATALAEEVVEALPSDDDDLPF